MLSIEMTPQDIARTRFAYTPLFELVISYRLLHRHKNGGAYRRWFEEANHALYGVDLPYLHALATRDYQIPDFLTPTPASPVTDVEAEFERMRQTPNDVIRKMLQDTIRRSAEAESEMMLHFMAYPREMLECLIEDLRVYWNRVLARHWSSMVSVLEGDMLYRARQWATDGSESLFKGLHPQLRLRANQIEYDMQKPDWMHQSHVLNGDGLHLIPAIFTHELMWQVAPEWGAMLVYQSRGTGLWWKESTPTPDQSLEIALGEGRARVLRTLAMPMNTGEIAQRLQITAGAASQHLNRLNQAGLVEPHRSGKRVYYHLTARGEKLLALFS